jgi:hypothetical protein
MSRNRSEYAANLELIPTRSLDRYRVTFRPAPVGPVRGLLETLLRWIAGH